MQSVPNQNKRSAPKLISCIFLMVSSFALLAQSNNSYQYFIGISEPPAEWKNPGFDDASWHRGSGSIGYGDDDDSTLIDTTTSLYLRYTIGDLTDLPESFDSLEGIVLDIDFDDGFIAYLNGNEILRINLPDEIESPVFDQTTIRSHEAEKYRFTLLGKRGFFIKTAILLENNCDSNSVLAFQVHNDSVQGSDLSFHVGVETIFIGDDGARGDGFYSSFQFLYRQLHPLDSTLLPIIKIETDEFGFGDPMVKHMIYPKMEIIDNSSGGYNKPADIANEYNGHIRGWVRGNLSKSTPKLSYNIETQDSLRNNNNVSLLGMPEENDWVLYGPFIDKSLIRNELIFELGRKMGHYQPRTRFCELLLNGQNMGLYVLTERIKRDKNRVDIARLNPWENDGNDVTGGYIFRFDPGSLEVISPDQDVLTPEQNLYMNTYWNSLKTVLNSNNFTNPVSGYHKYMDIPSFLDFILITELTYNHDGYRGSMYFHKDRDDKNTRIVSGPFWDYDYSMERVRLFEQPQEWRFQRDDMLNLNRYLQDSAFVDSLNLRWNQLRTCFLQTDSVHLLIDQIIQPLQSSIERNYQVWPSMHKPVLHQFDSLGAGYGDEIAELKRWLQERMEWMDENISNVLQPLVLYPSALNEFNRNSQNILVYPNPFHDHVKIKTKDIQTGQVYISISDFSGRLLYRKELQWNDSIAEQYIDLSEITEAGIYILKIEMDKEIYWHEKIVKLPN